MNIDNHKDIMDYFYKRTVADAKGGRQQWMARLLNAVGAFVVSIFLLHVFKSSGKMHPVTWKERPVEEKIGKASVIEVHIANAERKIAERHAWLGDSHCDGPEFKALPFDGHSPMWYLFVPYFPCLWTFEKVPGSDVVHDGGKWLCGLQELQSSRTNVMAAPACIVYSFGSNNDFTFEERVKSIAPLCDIHTFDPTSQRPKEGSPPSSFVTFHQDYGLAGENGLTAAGFAVKTLSSIMKDLGHKHVDVLKIDIEGYEWDVIGNTDWAGLKIGQLAVELHPAGEKQPRNADQMLRFFDTLETAGYYVASMEPVTRGNYAQVEIVFINKYWSPEGFEA